MARKNEKVTGAVVEKDGKKIKFVAKKVILATSGFGANREMIKKILVIGGICLLAGYLIFSAFYFEKKPQDDFCTSFEVEIKNTENFTLEDYIRFDKEIHDLKFRNIIGGIIKEFGRKTENGFILDF